jgi:hypothetical protein
MEKKQNISTIKKGQRTAMIKATGVLKTFPTYVLSIILYLLPIDLHIKSEATSSAPILRVRLLEEKTVWTH